MLVAGFKEESAGCRFTAESCPQMFVEDREDLLKGFVVA